MSKTVKFPSPEKAIVIQDKSKLIIKELQGLNQEEIVFLFKLVEYEIKSKSVVIVQ